MHLATEGGEVKTIPNGSHRSANVDNALALPNGFLHSPTGHVSIPPSLMDLPPEIRHITTGYMSLGTLYSRVAQLCTNDLKELIEELAKEPVEMQPNGGTVNGVGANRVGDISQTNVEKKYKWMDFAMTHRDRIIKVLVLSQWSRQVNSVSKLIDLRNWLFERQEEHNQTRGNLFTLAADLHNMKVWNPDIRTAFETLSTGKATQFPDLGFIPAEPLTARQILKTLRNVNSLLSIRLNLHEDLPQYLQDWSLGSGRVTFKIPTEFELDLSITDEEANSPFFFIDIRFLFSPKPDLTDGPVRQKIDQLANFNLVNGGLAGCFNFFHEFALTHKINVLRRQSIEMAQGLWSDTLRIDFNRRVLTVQYWKGQSGGKNWIEFGIGSGKRRDDKEKWKGAQPSQIAVRWHQNGKLARDSDLKFDWVDVSLEKMLRQVTSSHIKRILSTIRDGFINRLGVNKSINLELDESDGAIKLVFRFTNSKEYASVSVNQVTGSFSLQPASLFASQLENILNNSSPPPEGMLDVVARFIAWNLEQTVQRQADMSGWTRLRNITIKPDLLKASLKTPGRLCWFRGVGWNLSQWVVLANIRVAGDSWYAVQL